MTPPPPYTYTIPFPHSSVDTLPSIPPGPPSHTHTSVYTPGTAPAGLHTSRLRARWQHRRPQLEERESGSSLGNNKVSRAPPVDAAHSGSRTATVPQLRGLTRWGLDKMVTILQTTFSNIFLWMKNVWISLKISLKFVPKVRINNVPALVQIMAWRRPGDKPLSEPVMVSLLTHIYASLCLNELTTSPNKNL